MPTTPTPKATAGHRRVGLAAAGIALVLVAGACSSSSKTPAAGSTGKSASLLNKALQEQVAGNTAQAEKDYKAVIAADPQNKYAFYDLGLIYDNQGKNSLAEGQYSLALGIDAKYEPALYNLARLRALDGNTSGAITLYQQAIASNPKDANAHFNLGLLLRHTNKVAEGNAQVQTAVQLNPALASKATAQGVPLTGK